MLRFIDSCPNSLNNWSGFVDVALRMLFPLLVACRMIIMGAYAVCMWVLVSVLMCVSAVMCVL